MYTVSFFNQAQLRILAQAFYKLLPILVSSLKTIVEHSERSKIFTYACWNNEHLYKEQYIHKFPSILCHVHLFVLSLHGWKYVTHTDT